MSSLVLDPSLLSCSIVDEELLLDLLVHSPRFAVWFGTFFFYHRVFRTVAGSLSVGGNAG